MSAAPDWTELARVDRGLDRLLTHYELFGRLTADSERLPARKRLERELGPKLARRLLTGLTSA